MFAKAAVALALIVAPVSSIAGSADDRASGKALAAACKDRSGWADPAPPARIFGDTYYVGTCGITVLLVASRSGHALVDTGPAEAAPLILANITALGFRPRDVRLIVGSHEHFDHMGGMAALKAATGARILLSDPARRVIESGHADPADPQAGTLPATTPAVVDGTVAKRPGPGARLTPVPTPGHTSGGTSWTWTECEKTRCLTMAYVDSLSAIARAGYRFTDHPDRIAPYRTTLATVTAIKCDVLITPHPGVSNLFERLAGAAALVDPSGCKRLADSATAALDKRLAGESPAPAR